MAWELSVRAFFAPFTRGWEIWWVWLIFLIVFALWLWSVDYRQKRDGGEGIFENLFGNNDW